LVGKNRLLNLALSIASRSKAVSHLIGMLRRLDDHRPDLLRVLTYHRVDEPDARPDLDPGLISATPAMFDEQMNYLASHYQVISMAELLDARRSGAALPPRSVMVTVDDAYCDFESNAWPILKKYGIPVTLFVPTGFPDMPNRAFWWDRLHQAVRGMDQSWHFATRRGRTGRLDSGERRRVHQRLKNWIKSLPHDRAMACIERICEASGTAKSKSHVLGWESLRRLAGEGVTLAAHSQTHPLMNRLTADEARWEAAGSLRDLQREIGPTLPVFAYPGGGFDELVVQALRTERFALAFTTARGMNDLQHADPLRLRRINVGARTNQPVFSAQLLPWLVHLNRWA
jgi:peptidoglycan/xylan/chitin deacetylase (PgdA/CDA1 family)